MLGLVISSTAFAAEDSVEAAGKARFMESCAVCHGPQAVGDGPYAALLNKKPANLTLLAKNNGGTFPFNVVYDSIDGRGPSGAHGTKDMPVWGSNWKGANAQGAETAVRGRILEMIIYLRSIQK
ncbi:MAG: cytochrome C [Gammaproteobacteria bacterium]|nr:cytochrome C [Gammaproteobacteria bacterium]